MRLLTEIEPVKRNPKPGTLTLEERLRLLDLSDAARYQRLASMNYESAKRYDNSATLMLATVQYAYARWLMFDDEYYLSMPYHLPHRSHRQGHAWHTGRAGAAGQVRTPTPWRAGPARMPR